MGLGETWQAAVGDQKISLFDSNRAPDGCICGPKIKVANR